MDEHRGLKKETLYDLFVDCYSHHLDDVAVIEDSGLGRSTMTYNELYNASTKVSKILGDILESTNLRSQFVAICMDQSLLLPAVILGILSKGLGFVFVDSLWSEDKQKQFIEKLACPCLIRSDCQASLWPDNVYLKLNVAGKALFIDRVASNSTTDSGGCVHAMAYAVQTSGSTGEPKTVRVRHASIVPNIRDLRHKLNINSKDVVFLSSPSTFDPSIVDIFLALTSGAALFVTSSLIKASPVALLKVLFPLQENAPSVSVLQMTPSVFSRWSEKEVKETVLGFRSPLRVLLLGGEPCMHLQKLMEWKDPGNKTDVYSIYGITEVSAWASIYRVESTSLTSSDSNNISENFNEVNTCLNLGQMLSDTLFQVRDLKTGSVVLEGIGEMFIGSCKRICEVDGENCLEFSSPLFRSTGDVVKILEGSFFYIGRKDHMVKRWGHRVSLLSVESLAMHHEALSAACCVWDEVKLKLYLFVITTEPVERTAIQRHFLSSSKEKNFLIPDEIYIVDYFPTDQHGKINRRMLLKTITEKGTSLRKPDLVLPSTTFTSEFINLWCRILGIQTNQICSEASFASLGGNSLLALCFTQHLEDQFGSVPDDLVSHLLSGKSFDFCLDRVKVFYSSDHSRNKINSDNSVIRNCELIKQDSQGSKVNESSSHKLVLASARGKTIGRFCKILKSCIKPAGTFEMVLSWKTNLEKCIDASPLCLVYESGTALIIIGSHSGKFTAIDGSSGVPKWSLLLPDRIESTACPSSCGMFTFVGCYNGLLYCVSIMTGEILWHFKTDGMIKCTPTLCNNGKGVIFGSYDHHVYCISSETGELLWKSHVTSPSGSWLSSPLVVGNVAVVCSLAAKLAAVETSTGRLMWCQGLNSPIFATPISLPHPSESLFVVAEVQGVLHCLHSSSAEKIWVWKVESGSHIFSSPTCADFSSQEGPGCLIIFGCHDSFVYCLEMNYKHEVSLFWKVSVHSPMASTPFVFPGAQSELYYLATVNSAGAVLVLDLKDGMVAAQYKLPSQVFSSPVVNNYHVYVGCRDNNVYCLSLSHDVKGNFRISE